MRIITSLIIASVVGSTAVGALKAYMSDGNEKNSKQIVRELFKQDRPAAMRLLERASFVCVPELEKLKTTKARKFLPRMLANIMQISRPNGKKLDSNEKDAIDKEVHQLLQTIPDTDAFVLAEVADHLRKERGKIANCLFKTFNEYVGQHQRAKKKTLLSDVELRGS